MKINGLSHFSYPNLPLRNEDIDFIIIDRFKNQ
jgi:hypothetical protein